MESSHFLDDEFGTSDFLDDNFGALGFQDDNFGASTAGHLDRIGSGDVVDRQRYLDN